MQDPGLAQVDQDLGQKGGQKIVRLPPITGKKAG